MDGKQFDALTRALGSGRSRRSLVKGLSAAALGAVGLKLGQAEAASNNNSACAHFCNQVFGADTTAAGQCTSQGAHGTGPCVTCANNPANYCNGGCATDYQTDVNNCGGCGHVCNHHDACATAICSGGVCGTTPVTCAAGDQCNAAATCDPLTGCGATTPLSGTPCTTSDNAAGTCQGGTCVANAIICDNPINTAGCAYTTSCVGCDFAGTCNSCGASQSGCVALVEGGAVCISQGNCGGTACTSSSQCGPGKACVHTCCNGGAGICQPTLACGAAAIDAAAVTTTETGTLPIP